MIASRISLADFVHRNGLGFHLDFDEGSDAGFEVLFRAMDSASDLLFGEKREKSLHLIDPRRSQSG